MPIKFQSDTILITSNLVPQDSKKFGGKTSYRLVKWALEHMGKVDRYNNTPNWCIISKMY